MFVFIAIEAEITTATAKSCCESPTGRGRSASSGDNSARCDDDDHHYRHHREELQLRM